MHFSAGCLQTGAIKGLKSTFLRGGGGGGVISYMYTFPFIDSSFICVYKLYLVLFHSSVAHQGLVLEELSTMK